jgi:hypothetical protein
MSLKSETFEKFLLFKKKLEMAQSQRHLRSGIKKDFGELGGKVYFFPPFFGEN